MKHQSCLRDFNQLHQYKTDEFTHFEKPPLHNVRDYLFEKEKMGFLKEVWIYTKLKSKPHRIRMYGVTRTMWEKVIAPGIQQYAEIEWAGTQVNSHLVEVRFKVKP